MGGCGNLMGSGWHSFLNGEVPKCYIPKSHEEEIRSLGQSKLSVDVSMMFDSSTGLATYDSGNEFKCCCKNSDPWYSLVSHVECQLVQVEGKSEGWFTAGEKGCGTLIAEGWN